MRVVKQWIALAVGITLTSMCAPCMPIQDVDYPNGPPLIVYPIWGVLLATLLTLSNFLIARGERRRGREAQEAREHAESRERERREAYDRLMRAEDERREKGLPALPKPN